MVWYYINYYYYFYNLQHIIACIIYRSISTEQYEQNLNKELNIIREIAINNACSVFFKQNPMHN